MTEENKVSQMKSLIYRMALMLDEYKLVEVDIEAKGLLKEATEVVEDSDLGYQRKSWYPSLHIAS